MLFVQERPCGTNKPGHKTLGRANVLSVRDGCEPSFGPGPEDVGRSWMRGGGRSWFQVKGP